MPILLVLQQITLNIHTHVGNYDHAGSKEAQECKGEEEECIVNVQKAEK